MSAVSAPTSLTPHPFRSDEAGTELVASSRRRLQVGVGQEAMGIALAVGFVVLAVGALFVLPAVRPFSWLATATAVAVYAGVSRVRFEIGHGTVIPTQLVLVPLLFALPPRIVPLVAAAGLVLGGAKELQERRWSPTQIPLLVASATHVLGPAIVLSLAAPHGASLSSAPIYLGALAAQFAADLVPGMIFSRVVLGIPVIEHARSMRVVFLVDTALAPIGLVVALAFGTRVWGVLLVLPLVALLKVFALERQVRIDHALELSAAYRGTAALLGDVIEADDEYTGNHSRDVVELVVSVADRLGLDPSQRRQAEFAAALHDVGKVKIPPSVINKPGPLDAAERALMDTHTLVGQAMLDKIGGLLGDVGRIVRSCHERWDGTGYPDRLAGEEIPLEARIICACDAWSAMTADRVYRRALTPSEAAAELRACSGTHFDPRVVDALAEVLGLEEIEESETERELEALAA